MTREELFRAVGEVREDQIEAAEAVKKQVHPWRRFGALAACLALVVTAVGVSATELGEADLWNWKAIVWSFNPSAEVNEDPDSWKTIVQPFNPGEADSGGGAAAVTVGLETSGLSGGLEELLGELRERPEVIRCEIPAG